MNIIDKLLILGEAGRPLAMRELRPFSDIDPALQRSFLDTWNTIEPGRRVEIVRAMVDLAEDNVDLLFHTVLSWCLTDEQPQVRATAIEGLWESESPAVLRQLRNLLRDDPVPEVRAQAAIGLSRFAYMAEMGDLDDELAEQLLRSLVGAFRDQRQPVEIRRRALESAGYYASSDVVVTEIEQAYASSEPELRESALVAMGRSMLPRWLPSISQELASRSPAMRYEAARAAGELGEEGRPLLMRVARLLGDSDTEVALAAIWALGQIGGEAAKRVLRDASKSEHEARAQAASDALAELSLEQGLVGDVRGIGPRGGNLN